MPVLMWLDHHLGHAHDNAHAHASARGYVTCCDHDAFVVPSLTLVSSSLEAVVAAIGNKRELASINQHGWWYKLGKVGGEIASGG